MKITTSTYFSLLLGSSIAVVACGGGEAASGGTTTTGTNSTSGGSGGGGTSGGLPCDVADILAENCQQCHSAKPVFGAPMPLMTYGDLVAPAKSDASKKVYELVEKRIHDAAAPMPQPPNPALSADALKTMDDWIASGAPKSADSCGSGAGGGGAGGGGSTVSCVPDIHIEPATPWVMDKSTSDVYGCYGFDVTPAQKSQITALVPRIDNKTIVHHILLFQADKSVSQTPAACSNAVGNGWRMVAVWAPGGQPMELPKEVGLPIDGTSHFVVQIHYSNLMHLDGETDTTGYDLCSTTELRPNEGDILAFGTTNFTIPAAGSLDITCDFDVPAGLPGRKAIGGMPHMHQIGKSISTWYLPGGSGAKVDLGTREKWDFNSQYWTDLDTTVSGGDKVQTRCAWDNPGASPVTYGEKTEDEMCFSFVFYYPRITTPGWNWILPAVSSKCAPTK